VIVAKKKGKWFVFRKIEKKNLLYFDYFSLLYSESKTPLIFLIYYKFAIVGSYGKSFLGVAGAKP
jgi:hypothetical protein